MTSVFENKLMLEPMETLLQVSIIDDNLADANGGGQTSGGREVENAANNLLDMFLRMLETDAARMGGSLTTERMRLIADSLRSNRDAVEPLYEAAYRACFKMVEREAWMDKRVNCLGRILVHHFLHLVSNDENLPVDSPKFSRPCIPGFIEILIMAIGRDYCDVCYAKAQEIVARIKKATGKQIVWDEFYVSAEGQVLVREVLLSLMEQFDDFDKRRTWFIEVMNTHLDHHHGAEQRGNGSAHWRFRTEHFQHLMQALYTDLPGLGDDLQDGAKRAALAAFLARIDVKVE